MSLISPVESGNKGSIVLAAQQFKNAIQANISVDIEMIEKPIT